MAAVASGVLDLFAATVFRLAFTATQRSPHCDHQRIIKRLNLIGRTEGWLFRKSNGVDRALAGDYADNIYTKLEILQRKSKLIDPGVDVREAYRVQCSGRRFFDTQCINMKVSTTDIEFQCRWRTDRERGGRSVSPSMLHTYAEVRNMRTTLLRPSQAL
eukprot:scaffold54634_cov23-Cyclotella_meneghiniana.AAC.4